jgi:hypothetical protein
MPAAPRRYLILVPRPLPAAPLVVRRRYLNLVPRPLPAAPLVVRRRYLIVVHRLMPAATRRYSRSTRRTTRKMYSETEEILPALSVQWKDTQTEIHCWWCWRAQPAAIDTFMKPLHFAEHHPIRIRDERGRLVTALPVIKKIRDPSWKKQIPGERPRETAKT